MCARGWAAMLEGAVCAPGTPSLVWERDKYAGNCHCCEIQGEMQLNSGCLGNITEEHNPPRVGRGQWEIWDLEFGSRKSEVCPGRTVSDVQ